MKYRDFFAGLFLFLAGAACAFAYAYRERIATFLRLKKDGTIDAATDLAAAAEKLIKKFSPPQGK